MSVFFMSWYFRGLISVNSVDSIFTLLLLVDDDS